MRLRLAVFAKDDVFSSVCALPAIGVCSWAIISLLIDAEVARTGKGNK